MLTRLLSLALALSFGVSLTTAQTVQTAQTATAGDTPLDKALLWRIDDGVDSTASSYLFGTIHLIGAEDFLVSDSLMIALNRSERVTFEIDPSEMTNPMVAMGLMQKAFMQGDTTLRDVLTAEEYGVVKDHFKQVGLPMMFLDRVKPMFLSMLAGMDGMDLDLGSMLGGGGTDDDDEADGEGGIKSYELELNKIAKATDKRIGGLETTDFQLGLFDSIPYRAQADMLMAAIEAPAGAQDDQLAELTKIYVTGDVDGMYAMTVGSEGGLGGFERTLLVNRNLNWVAPMKEQIAAGATLFAVGAGHLGGPQGMVRLLRAEGYTLTPMSVR